MFFDNIQLKKLENTVDIKMEKEFEKDPIMKGFHTSDWFDENYYKRHILECVTRIHMNNELDANAVKKSSTENTEAAKKMSFYLYDELGHDEMFIKDLNLYNYTKEDTKPENAFPATWKLMGYLNFCVDKFGPLAAITWDWFLEYYGEKYNSFITQKAAKEMGKNLVLGAAAHVAYDEEEDHSSMMTEMLSSVIKNENDLKLAITHINQFVPMVGEYFNSLKQT